MANGFHCWIELQQQNQALIMSNKESIAYLNWLRRLIGDILASRRRHRDRDSRCRLWSAPLPRRPRAPTHPLDITAALLASLACASCAARCSGSSRCGRCAQKRTGGCCGQTGFSCWTGGCHGGGLQQPLQLWLAFPDALSIVNDHQRSPLSWTEKRSLPMSHGL